MLHVPKEPIQTELLEFLHDPDSYPHAPPSVSVEQTHTAFVAIAPPFAYKIKKTVNFGFLDYSTLELRQHFCEAEVTLNSRLCPDLYEGVVPIYRNNGTLSFEPNGDVVEYAVKMRHLSKGQFLDQLVEQGQGDEKAIDRIVLRLEPFYQTQASSPAIAEWGRSEKLKVNTDENVAQTEHVISTLVSRVAFEAIRYYTNRFFDHHALLFARRRTKGHIKDCHGDLHLHHIYLTPEQVNIYDCIEFNERFRYSDVSCDIAFLAMDLDFHGRSDLARYFVKRMSEVLHDPDLEPLTDFYKCYRAYVRAKVEGMRSEQAEVPEAQRRASSERAKHYYQLALQYALSGSSPAVIVVMGQVGTGKTTQAEAVAGSLGCDIFSSDTIRKTLAGVPLFERGSSTERANLYRKEMTHKVYEMLQGQALNHAKQGQMIVLDATYGNPHYRAELRTALANSGVPCFFVELAAPDAILKNRLQERDTSRDMISDARLEDFELLQTHYQAPDALEDARHFVVSTEAKSVDDTTLEILKHVIRLQHE